MVLEAMRPNLKAAHKMGYSAYATSSSETCSNQRESILQIPFSSPAVADVTSADLAGKAGEKASDAIECRVF